MNEATFDPSRELTLYFRCNRAGSKNFVFTYSDGSAYSFIYDEIELNIYKNQGDKKKLISLTHVLGITLSSNTVTATVTKALTNIPEGEYYWELYRTDLEQTWLTGNAFFHNGVFDGVNTDTSSITVLENGETISITVTNASSAPSGGGGVTALDGQTGNLTLGAVINSLTGKNTPVDGDFVAIMDSAAANASKKVSWANIKATLKTYFDTLYAAALGADDNYVTDSEKTKLANLSGTNTGDQDLSGLMVKANNLSDLTNTTTARSNLGLGTLATQSGTFTDKQNLVNSATALTDASTMDLTAIKHTLATSSATRTFTISYTGDDITLEVTLSATSSTFTFPATALCVSEGTASGDNTLALAGVSGDKYMIAIKKVGSAYYVVCKNFGQ